ncbi:MAG: hypothetical protein QW156_04575 [Candidatus Aenigmatarchaeota archaeon]
MKTYFFILDCTLPANQTYTGLDFIVPVNFQWQKITGYDISNFNPLIRISNETQNYFYFNDYIFFSNLIPRRPQGNTELLLPKFEILNINDTIKVEMKVSASDINNRSIQLILIGEKL